MDKLISITLIGLCVFSGVISQLFMKSVVTSVGKITTVNFSLIKDILTNASIITGLFFYGLYALTWIVVLSRVPLSYAYPLLSLSLVFVALFSWYLFGEQLSSLRIWGIALIILGTCLVART